MTEDGSQFQHEQETIAALKEQVRELKEQKAELEEKLKLLMKVLEALNDYLTNNISDIETAFRKLSRLIKGPNNIRNFSIIKANAISVLQTRTGNLLEKLKRAQEIIGQKVD